MIFVHPLGVVPLSRSTRHTAVDGSRRFHHQHTRDASSCSSTEKSSMNSKITRETTRRTWIDTIKAGAILITTQQLLLQSQAVSAKPDCYTDCYKNCIALAPKDNVYCSESCTDYCAQDDREDGLSGSISSEKGEVGILGGSFGTGTVVKGQDKPPVLGRIPGLDFTSESGKKMIGYSK